MAINPIILNKRVEDILSCDGLGDFEVKQLTPYQYRVNGILDLYPVRLKFHNIKTQKRGKFPDPINNDLYGWLIDNIDAGVEVCAKDACVCGGRYVKRFNKANGNTFYGCNNYPTCKNTKSKL